MRASSCRRSTTMRSERPCGGWPRTMRSARRWAAGEAYVRSATRWKPRPPAIWLSSSKSLPARSEARHDAPAGRPPGHHPGGKSVGRPDRFSVWRKRFADDPVEFAFAGLSSGCSCRLGWRCCWPKSARSRSRRSAPPGPSWPLFWPRPGCDAGEKDCRARGRGRERQPAPGAAGRWPRLPSGSLPSRSCTSGRTSSSWAARTQACTSASAPTSPKTGGDHSCRTHCSARSSPVRPTRSCVPCRPGEAAPFYLLPGFYVTGMPADVVTPQFFHLHPAWQAVGYALGGLRAELWMTPLWGILGCLAVYLTVRALWGWRWALLALVVLSATRVAGMVRPLSNGRSPDPVPVLDRRMGDEPVAGSAGACGALGAAGGRCASGKSSSRASTPTFFWRCRLSWRPGSPSPGAGAGTRGGSLSRFSSSPLTLPCTVC